MNKKMNKQFDQDQQLVNQFLQTHIEQNIDQVTLKQAMGYSLLAGGKRLRPLLTISVLRVFGVDVNETTLKAALSVELIHTYSLIHDDLPAMDDDDLRRGVPTNHVKFGAGMATLAGDGLLTLAFQWLVDNQLPESKKSRLVYEMAKAAGPSGMVSGQAIDISSEGQHLDLAALQHLHREKTGALIRYSLIAGGVLADVDEPTLNLLIQFGENFGLAFQIYDDLLDVTATTAEMGKRTHKDEAEQKNTYPELLGVEGTKQALTKTLETARHNLSNLNKQTGRDVEQLSQFLTYFKL
jgi:geranylgeranyl diphosphate synthase type II